MTFCISPAKKSFRRGVLLMGICRRELSVNPNHTRFEVQNVTAANINQQLLLIFLNNRSRGQVGRIYDLGSTIAGWSPPLRRVMLLWSKTGCLANVEWALWPV